METELVSLLTAAFALATFQRFSGLSPFRGDWRHAWLVVAGLYVLVVAILIT